jgi:uncharacterized membrane protein (DUF373 family)
VLERWRDGLERTLSILEQLVYALLAVSLVGAAFVYGAEALQGVDIAARVAPFLDSLLILLMLMELFHTVMLFLRTHRFHHEPFLVVGMIAGVRRLLVLTAEESAGSMLPFGHYLLELSVTTAVILVLAVALRLTARVASE